MSIDNNAQSTDAGDKFPAMKKDYNQMFDECYNTGVDACIEKAKLKHDECDEDASVQTALYLLIEELEQLKKPIPKNI